MTKRETVSVVIVSISVFVLLFAFVSAVYDLVKSTPFRPVEGFPVIVENEPVESGGLLEIRNGLCNTDRERSFLIEVFVGLQSENVVEGSQGITPLLGTESEPTSLILFPGCIGTQPVPLQLPAVEQGMYHVFIRVVLRGPSGQEQRVLLTSAPFMIYEKGGGSGNGD